MRTSPPRWRHHGSNDGSARTSRLRPVIHRAGEGHHLVESDLVEGDIERSPCRVGGIALPPRRPPQAPADLDGGGERSLEAGHVEAGEPDERTAGSHLQRPGLKRCSSKPASMRSMKASLSSRLRGSGKYSVTSRSAFIAANGARSRLSQRRSTNRSVRIAGRLTRSTRSAGAPPLVEGHSWRPCDLPAVALGVGDVARAPTPGPVLGSASLRLGPANHGVPKMPVAWVPFTSRSSCWAYSVRHTRAASSSRPGRSRCHGRA
jgi:hypothetical protein